MRFAEDEDIEVRTLDDGREQARRKDRKPMTEADREKARRLLDDMDRECDEARDRDRVGITVEDVLRVFPPGSRVVPNTPKPERCLHCDRPSTPKWRRGGRIIPRLWPDGRLEWACHFCGRRIEE